MSEKQKVEIFPKSSPRCDHVPLRVGEAGYGYYGDSGTVGLIRCHCGEEIPGPGVSYGICNACGYNLKVDFKNQYPKLFSK